MLDQRGRVVRCSISILLATVAAVASAGCGNDSSSCTLADVGMQPIHRFPVGSTLMLPAGSSGCGDAAWKVTSAPPENRNEVVAAEDGARFTPHVPGDYTFTLAGKTVTVNVIGTDAVPFQQYNYYSTRSLAAVDAEVWVANVYAASITPIANDVAGTPIPVGAWPVAVAWRPGMQFALVAQRAADSLGLVDVADHRIVDAIPVGDEPANVVVSPDGAIAYVALSVSGRIAVVDLASRTVTRHIELVPDIAALAVSPDGRVLYAARLRSGQPVRAPFPDTPVAAQRDLFIVDAATGQIQHEDINIGSTIRELEVSADGHTLYAALLSNETTGNIADGKAHFLDQIVRFDAATGEELARVDIGRQQGSTGMAVTVQGMVELGDELWVAAEGSDVVVAIDRMTLAERRRIPAPGRPRALVAMNDRVLIHGPQGFVVTSVDRSGAGAHMITTARDPRPGNEARGQQIFTGAGKGYGADHSCNTCHAEGLTDTQVWKVGPVGEYATPRPLFWLEGTYPLGWPAYLSDVRNWGYEGGSTIGVRPTTAEAEDLASYLASIVPPPAANDGTRFDGSLSDAAIRGKEVFEGDGGCTACHRPPLFTSRKQLDEGVTPGRTDIPSLVGVYRHGVWLKDGSATTLDDAVRRVVSWLGGELDDAQLADVTEYVRELTGRDFFMLSSLPRDKDAHVAVDQPIVLTFSSPVWNDPTNLARVTLTDASGAAVAANVTADGRHVTIVPQAQLAFSTGYAVHVDEGFEAFDERKLATTKVTVTTAAAPALGLDGNYTWSFGAPSFNPQTGMFDPTRPSPVALPLTATRTASGADLSFDLGQGLTYKTHAVIDGSSLVLQPLPVPVGPTLANTSPAPGDLVDDDHDGQADRVDAKLLFTGPGILFDNLAWKLERPVVGCVEGASGDVSVTVDRMGSTAKVSWAGTDAAIGLYVTDPSASLPTGPGTTVSGGKAYWTIQSSNFPTGFAGPVVYGTVPTGASDVGAAQMATFETLQQAKCYKFSVTTTAFKSGSRVMRW